MSEEAVKVAVTEEQATEPKPEEAKQSEAPALAAREWWPLETLRREVERVFDEFYRGPWRLPFSRTAFDVGPVWPGEAIWGAAPAVDIVERDQDYVITAEMPGVPAGNVDVRLADERLTIKGEKEDKSDEERKGVHISERRYGSFQRTFRVPEGVDRDKIAASFANGVLTVTLPKTAEAMKAERTIDVKAA
ncbi:MAG TPA: Hsp20/alpha crystallin family protein [Pseudolabrys sp.]|nr:Hsp20/alpha crystallin family protein [Pseudolabrys sp.]